MMKHTLKPPFFLAFSAAMLAGCGGSTSTSSDTALDSGDENLASYGQVLNVQLADAPIDDASHVYITVAGISLSTNGETWEDHNFSEPEKIDLLTLQSGNTFPLLSDLTVEPGRYSIRLNLSSEEDLAHSIVLSEGGEAYEISIPSGDQTGLKLVSPIIVSETGNASYTIDFDVRKSIVRTGNASSTRFSLKPTLKLINNDDVGYIAGTISEAQLTDASCSDSDSATDNAVYVYAGSSVTPDDIGGQIADDDIVTTPVVYNADSGTYTYKVPYLAFGDYTVAFTCNANLEDVEADDELSLVVLEESVTVTSAN